jgi:iron complex transport system substrate-binding protein
VSLSPGITDALFAIGVGGALVARSDYCDYPSEVTRLPRVGSSITPNYEAIARLEPTLIVSEDNAAARRRELEALAPTLLLKWLSLDEVARGIRELGRVTGSDATAAALAERLERRLGVPAPEAAPKILLVIGSDTGRIDDVWFIRKNSLQGAALHAAGARNAIAEDVSGQPRLSLERLVALDPDGIVVLTLRERPSDAELAPYRKLQTLRAVRNDHLVAVAAPEAYVNGPRVLALVERLVPVVREMSVGPGPHRQTKQPP